MGEADGLTTAVRRITQRLHTRCKACSSSCSSVSVGTKRIRGRCTAPAMVSARKSLLFVWLRSLPLEEVVGREVESPTSSRRNLHEQQWAEHNPAL